MIATEPAWPASAGRGEATPSIAPHNNTQYLSGAGEIAMYRTANGEEIFVIDGHTHFWDGSPANQKNIHGKQFIECFYAYHSNLSPPSEKWDEGEVSRIRRQDDAIDDLFVAWLRRHGDLAADLSRGFLQERLQHHRTQRGDEEEPSRTVSFSTAPLIRATATKGSEACMRIPRSTRSRASSSTPPNGTASPRATNSPTRTSYKFLEAAQKLRHQEHPRSQGPDDHSA